MFYTSGSTGFPKGAYLHHKGITNNARYVAERLGLESSDTLQLGSPFDYARQARLILPQSMPDPQQDVAYAHAVALADVDLDGDLDIVFGNGGYNQNGGGEKGDEVSHDARILAQAEGL